MTGRHRCATYRRSTPCSASMRIRSWSSVRVLPRSLLVSPNVHFVIDDQRARNRIAAEQVCRGHDTALCPFNLVRFLESISCVAAVISIAISSQGIRGSAFGCLCTIPFCCTHLLRKTSVGSFEREWSPTMGQPRARGCEGPRMESRLTAAQVCRGYNTALYAFDLFRGSLFCVALSPVLSAQGQWTHSSVDAVKSWSTWVSVLVHALVASSSDFLDECLLDVEDEQPV